MDSPTLTLEHEGISYSVRFDRMDGDRPQFHYRIAGPGDLVLDEGTEFRLGSGQEAAEGAALQGLFQFLGAFAEAVAYSRDGRESANLCLFRAPVRAIAEHVGSDGYAMLAMNVWPEEA